MIQCQQSTRLPHLSSLTSLRARPIVRDYLRRKYCSLFEILIRGAAVPCVVFGRSDCNKMGALWAIAQGLFTAVAPRRSVAVGRRMLGTSFENAEQLEPRASYLRQVRAMGIGLAAAGIAGFVMETVAQDDADPDGGAADEVAESTDSA